MKSHIEMINGFPVIKYDDSSYSSASVTPIVRNENNIEKLNSCTFESK